MTKYRKGKRRGFRRGKGFKKYRKSYANTTNIVPYVNFGKGFPRIVKIVHKYVDQALFTCTSGVMNSYQFSCNGMYDPNITGTGHQPLYFDQMAVFYRHYQVIGSKCTFKILPFATNTTTILVGAFINDDTSYESSTYIYNQMEQDTGKSRFMPILGGTSQPAELTLKWSSKKWFANKGLASSTLQGTPTTNPSEQSYYSLLCQTFDGTTTTSIQFLVEIEYIAIWSERNDLAPS